MDKISEMTHIDFCNYAKENNMTPPDNLEDGITNAKIAVRILMDNPHISDDENWVGVLVSWLEGYNSEIF